MEKKYFHPITYRLRCWRLKKAVKIASAQQMKPVLTMLIDTLDSDPTWIFSHCNLTSSLNCTQLCVIFVITYITGLLFQRYLHRTLLIYLLEIYLITEKIWNNSSQSYMLAKQGREVKGHYRRSMTNTLLHCIWRDFLHVPLTFRSHSYWCTDSAMRRLPETERSR